MKTAVIVSTWGGQPPDDLRQLYYSMKSHPAGMPHDLVLCVNGLDCPLEDGLRTRFSRIFVRENTGYNIGAWDHAWRNLPEYERFLFLQPDCKVRKHGWLRDFAMKFDAVDHCGLLGENIERPWDKPWSELSNPDTSGMDDLRRREAEQKARWAIFFLEKLKEWNIPEGKTARNVTSVVQYTSRDVLEAVGGYNFGLSKLEATAAEIGFSRKVAATGRTLLQLGRWRHSRILHPQWPRNDPVSRITRSITKRLFKN